MKKRLVLLVCDNPACRKESPEDTPLEGSVEIPRAVMQTSSQRASTRKDIYACSAACAGLAVQHAFGVHLPTAS